MPSVALAAEIGVELQLSRCRFKESHVACVTYVCPPLEWDKPEWHISKGDDSCAVRNHALWQTLQAVHLSSAQLMKYCILRSVSIVRSLELVWCLEFLKVHN